MGKKKKSDRKVNKIWRTKQILSFNLGQSTIEGKVSPFLSFHRAGRNCFFWKTDFEGERNPNHLQSASFSEWFQNMEMVCLLIARSQAK